jgi:hypothetical protein
VSSGGVAEREQYKKKPYFDSGKEIKQWLNMNARFAVTSTARKTDVRSRGLLPEQSGQMYLTVSNARYAERAKKILN